MHQHGVAGIDGDGGRRAGIRTIDLLLPPRAPVDPAQCQGGRQQKGKHKKHRNKAKNRHGAPPFSD
jgi:hypothetical protein